MEGLNGFDFLQFRKESAELKRIPVLVMSGLNDKASVMRAISLGATDYLLKPLRNTALLQVVRKHLKLTSNRSFRFPIEDQPKVTLSINAEISSMSDVGIDVTIPAKIAPCADVKLIAEVLLKLELDTTPLKNTLRGGKYTEAGYYLNRLNFVGIGEEAVNKIRNFLKEAS